MGLVGGPGGEVGGVERVMLMLGLELLGGVRGCCGGVVEDGGDVGNAAGPGFAEAEALADVVETEGVGERGAVAAGACGVVGLDDHVGFPAGNEDAEDAVDVAGEDDEDGEDDEVDDALGVLLVVHGADAGDEAEEGGGAGVGGADGGGVGGFRPGVRLRCLRRGGGRRGKARSKWRGLRCGWWRG